MIKQKYAEEITQKLLVNFSSVLAKEVIPERFVCPVLARKPDPCPVLQPVCTASPQPFISFSVHYKFGWSSPVQSTSLLCAEHPPWPLISHGSSPPRLHLGPLSLWLRLGQSLFSLCHGHPGFQMCFVHPPLQLHQAPPSLRAPAGFACGLIK